MLYYNSNLKENPDIIDANGPCLIDKKGNHLFDLWLGSGTLLFGHEKLRHNSISKMLPEASLMNNNDPSLITNLVDFEIGSFGIQTSGSAAITRACRVARAITNRRLIALIGDFWHGSEDEFLFRKNYELFSDGLAISPAQNYVWFESIASFLSKENRQDFAAILVEPSQGSNPKINMVKDLINKKTRESLRENNILIILDEVITGFRHNYGSSQIARECDPDIVVFGKAIGGGYPIGVVLVSDMCTKIAKDKKIFWGGTFSANPVQLELMIQQLDKLNKLDFNVIKQNLENICKFILNNLNLDELGFHISKGNGFARIVENNQNVTTSRGFLLNKIDLERKLDKLFKDNNLYISKNRLIFASKFNINNFK